MKEFFGLARELLEKGLACQADSYGPNNTYDTAITYSADLDFYLRLANNTEGEILDIGCGTGRVLLPLLKAGHRVTGLDLSCHMLDIAKQKLAFENFTAPLILGDMKDFNLKQRFGLIIIPYFAMIYIYSNEDRLRVLNSCHRHLVPGGHIAFDFDAGINNVGQGKPWLGFQIFDPSSGQVIVQTVQINFVEDRLRIVNIITYRFKGSGSAEIEVNSCREASISAVSMKELLEKAGFSEVGLYGDYRYTPYAGGEECIAVAQVPF